MVEKEAKRCVSRFEENDVLSKTGCKQKENPSFADNMFVIFVAKATMQYRKNCYSFYPTTFGGLGGGRTSLELKIDQLLVS